MAVVRDMRPAESSAVAQLLLRCNQEHLDVFPAAVARAYARDLADVAGRLPRADVLVAEDGDALLGTVTLLRRAEDDDHPWPPGGAVLRLLAVVPEARGEGIGGALARACVARAWAAGARYVGLHTAPSMAAARVLYEGLGFVRRPQHDFFPDVHYGGGRVGDEPAWGLAYVLRRPE